MPTLVCLLALAALAVTSCTVPLPGSPPPTHPASPEATEGPVVDPTTSLRRTTAAEDAPALSGRPMSTGRHQHQPGMRMGGSAAALPADAGDAHGR